MVETIVAPQVNPSPPQAIQSPADSMCPELQAVATWAELHVFASYGHATQALLMNKYPAWQPVGVKKSEQVATF